MKSPGLGSNNMRAGSCISLAMSLVEGLRAAVTVADSAKRRSIFTPPSPRLIPLALSLWLLFQLRHTLTARLHSTIRALSCFCKCEFADETITFGAKLAAKKMVQLTEELIKTRIKTDSFHNIKKLNLWGCDLEGMSCIRHITFRGDLIFCRYFDAIQFPFPRNSIPEVLYFSLLTSSWFLDSGIVAV